VTARPARPLPDSLSNATGRPSRGCSARPAATLSPPRPRTRKVAIGSVRNGTVQMAKAKVSDRGGRPPDPSRHAPIPRALHRRSSCLRSALATSGIRNKLIRGLPGSAICRQQETLTIRLAADVVTSMRPAAEECALASVPPPVHSHASRRHVSPPAVGQGCPHVDLFAMPGAATRPSRGAVTASSCSLDGRAGRRWHRASSSRGREPTWCSTRIQMKSSCTSTGA